MGHGGGICWALALACTVAWGHFCAKATRGSGFAPANTLPQVVAEDEFAIGHPEGLRFGAVDLREIESWDIETFLGEVRTAWQADYSRWSLEDREQDARAQTLLKIQRFLEQSEQFERQRLRHVDELERRLLPDFDSEDVTGELQSMRTRLDVARQRWSQVNEQLEKLDARKVELMSNAAILREFVQDDLSLARYLLALAEREMAKLESEMLRAEFAWLQHVLNQYPNAIRRLEQRLVLDRDLVGSQNTMSSPSQREEASNRLSTTISANVSTGVLAGDSRNKLDRFSGISNAKTESRGGGKLLRHEKIPGDGVVKRGERGESIATFWATLPDPDGLLQRAEQAGRSGTRTRRQWTRIHDQSDNLKEKIELVGLTEVNEMACLDAYRQLPDEAEIQIQIVEAQAELRQVGADLIGFESVLNSLNDAAVQGDQVDEEVVPGKGDERGDDPLNKLKMVVEAYQDLHADLLKAIAEKEQLLRVTRETRAFLSARLMWVQTTPVLQLSDFPAAWNGLWTISTWNAWVELGWGVVGRAVHRPVGMLLFLAALVGLQWGSHQIARRKPSRTGGSL